MKKRSIISLAGLMAVILSCLFIFMCIPFHLKKIEVTAGEAVLSGEDIGNRIYMLDGDWEFYYGQQLDPADFTAVVPEGGRITVPASWEAEGYPHNGYSTYRLHIKTDSNARLLMHILNIFGAYKIWINGEFCYQNGISGRNAKQNAFSFRSAMVPLSSKDGSIEIIIQVSNYQYYNSGITRSVFLGGQDHVWDWFLRTRGLYVFTLGSIFMTGIYHLVLYIFRRKEKAYLLFSVLCILCFLRFCYEEGGITSLMGIGGQAVTSVRLYNTLLFLHSTAIGIFSVYVFHKDTYRKWHRAMHIYILSGTGVFLLMPMHLPFGVLLLLGLVLGYFPGAAAVAVGVRNGILQRRNLTWLFFIALILYLTVGVVFKVLLQNTWYMLGLFNNMFLVLAKSLVLSHNYTRAFEMVEESNENLEQIVSECTSALQTAHSAMKELIGNISHDLKTPLTVMSVNLEQLAKAAERLDDENDRRLIHIAYNKNLDLQRLTQNLFEVSRIETGRIKYDSDWISLSWLLGQIQEKYNDYLESEQISLNITSREEGMIFIDRLKIWGVFDNIIYNAVRYTEAEGMISVSTEPTGEDLTIFVQDTGCGIEPEHLPHVFERFYMVSAQGKENGEGGLGLYIVKNIVEGTGGSVKIRSKPGKGTTVSLLFRYKN